MRSILVGVVALVVAAGGPAFGGTIVNDDEMRPRPATEPAVIEPAPPVTHERMEIHQHAPFRDVVVEDYHSAGAEWGMGVASTVLSIFYTPVRLTVGVVGAALGGFEGFVTGGNMRTARSMWRPTVEGDYFIRPDHLDRTERYEFGNFAPIAHERYTLHGRQGTLREDETSMVEATPPETVVAVPESRRGTPAPVEPAPVDSGDDR